MKSSSNEVLGVGLGQYDWSPYRLREIWTQTHSEVGSGGGSVLSYVDMLGCLGQAASFLPRVCMQRERDFLPSYPDFPSVIFILASRCRDGNEISILLNGVILSTCPTQ